MIWATVNSRSCFCWLHRTSPSSGAKNIINLISVLTIWRCPCADFSLVLLEGGVCYDQCILLAKNSVSICPASFCTPWSNLPVTSGVSWLPTFALHPPIMKMTSFWGVSSKRSDGDCSHEIKRSLLLGRNLMRNLDSIFKSRDSTLPTNVLQSKLWFLQ